MKKHTFAPVVEKDRRLCFRELTPESSLFRDKFGIYTPLDGAEIEPRELDVVLAPLVAFDANNHRIGMGGGYFDQTFAFLKWRNLYFHPRLIGLSFACQQVEKIAPNPWDIRLFYVVTEL